jgi:uncharacterized damage-inducible protein DinB
LSASSTSLKKVFEGWDGYNTSLVKAVEQSTPEALAHSPGPDMRTAGEVFRHVALGRVNWFHRMNAPGSAELVRQIEHWVTDSVGNRYIKEEEYPTTAPDLIHWLEATWGMIERALDEWTVEDLYRTYRHTFMGQTYAVSYQWTVWRIMAHDIHHGGQLTILLGSQGIDLPELAWLGGHLTEPPLAD